MSAPTSSPRSTLLQGSPSSSPPPPVQLTPGAAAHQLSLARLSVLQHGPPPPPSPLVTIVLRQERLIRAVDGVSTRLASLEARMRALDAHLTSGATISGRGATRDRTGHEMGHEMEHPRPEAPSADRGEERASPEAPEVAATVAAPAEAQVQALEPPPLPFHSSTTVHPGPALIVRPVPSRSSAGAKVGAALVVRSSAGALAGGAGAPGVGTTAHSECLGSLLWPGDAVHRAGRAASPEQQRATASEEPLTPPPRGGSPRTLAFTPATPTPTALSRAGSRLALPLEWLPARTLARDPLEVAVPREDSLALHSARELGRAQLGEAADARAAPGVRSAFRSPHLAASEAACDTDSAAPGGAARLHRLTAALLTTSSGWVGALSPRLTPRTAASRDADAGGGGWESAFAPILGVLKRLDDAASAAPSAPPLPPEV